MVARTINRVNKQVATPPVCRRSAHAYGLAVVCMASMATISKL